MKSVVSLVRLAGVLLLPAALLALHGCAASLPASLPNRTMETIDMTHHASGTFEVKLAPKPADDAAAAAGPGRMSIDKQFHGGLEASSIGQMLAYRTAVEGSAGYVAIERVTGSLSGRRGSFVLQHSGTMERGVPVLSVTVVPDSGTDELAGLSGRMDIVIDGGRHDYTFDYHLPAKP